MRRPKTYRSAIQFDKATGRVEGVFDCVGLPIGGLVNTAEGRKGLLEKFPRAESFGWLGTTANQFHPGIKPADWMPKAEDFVDVPFRLLTATVVGVGTYKATDFSDTGVLKGSMEMLLNKSVYLNHDKDVEGGVGYVKDVSWSEARTASDGTAIPAGIDGLLSLDAKSNPKIARDCLTGIIYSNSVTVIFDWVPSHPVKDDDMWSFWDRLGDAGEDGKIVSRKVVAIYDYHETSLVWLGADPFAKRINEDGSLRNIEKASVANLSKEDRRAALKEEAEQYNQGGKRGPFKLDNSLTREVVKLHRDAGRPADSNKDSKDNSPTMNKAAQAALAKLLGKTEDSITEADIASLSIGGSDTALKGLVGMSIVDDKGTALAFDGKPESLKATATTHSLVSTAHLTALTAKAEEAAREAESLRADAALGKVHLAHMRTETERLYRLSVGEKVQDSVLGLIKTGDASVLNGLLGTFTKGTTERFAAKCKSCGSGDFEFRSSFETGEEKPAPRTAPKSAAEIAAERESGKAGKFIG